MNMKGLKISSNTKCKKVMM